MEDAIRKSEVLIEALPYIKKFFKKHFVIKFGGSALNDDKARRSVLEDIVFMNFAGINPVLVHGGGPNINERLKAAGIAPKFVNGLRVTDKDTMAIVDSELNELNQKIVEEIRAIGGKSFGLSGKENKLLIATKAEAEVDLGFVGKVKTVDTTVMDRLIETDIIPVISPVSMGEDGNLYNVNADDAAAAIAISIKAEKFIMLTNVEGVMLEKDSKRSLLDSLSFMDVQYLVEKNYITGGMIPKVNSCLLALDGKVKKSHIISAMLPHALLLEIYTDRGIGTEIVKTGKRTKATEGI